MEPFLSIISMCQFAPKKAWPLLLVCCHGTVALQACGDQALKAAAIFLEEDALRRHGNFSAERKTVLAMNVSIQIPQSGLPFMSSIFFEIL